MENQQIPLIERTESFSLIVSPELEKTIRILCDKFPHNEYSGTLFYTVEGSIHEKNLVVTAHDFYLQDIGTGGATEFKNDATMAGYMVEHGLFNCYQGLMHSHNAMPTFFSGTDKNTLISEGNDTNHFVSLIVNNNGKYSAAITRKVTKKTVGKVSIDYESFNGKKVHTEDSEYTKEESVIEYFPLIINKPNIPVAKTELELRIEELQRNQKTYVNQFKGQGQGFLSRVFTGQNSTEYKEPKQLTLFDDFKGQEDEEYAEVDVEEVEVNEFKDYNGAHFDPTVIAAHAATLITGNIFARFNQKLDLEKWVKNMPNIYGKRFTDETFIEGFENFKYFADSIVDVLQNESMDEVLLENIGDEDSVLAIWAQDLISELTKYGTNEYINYYVKTLNRFI